jgi:hypothetical protein
VPFFRPTPTPYEPLLWKKLPFEPRARQACEAWALDGYGAPGFVYLFYALKVALYVAGWLGFCALTPSLGPPSELSRFALEPLAFQKAILWSLLFEGSGLGCGSGPLSGRYVPPFAAALHFLRPGTLRLPWLPRVPGLRGHRRTWFDVLLHAGIVAATLRALVAPGIGPAELLPLIVLIPPLALRDRTTFLAFRGEHYFTTIVVFVAAPNFIAGAQAVQLALWFWAGVSKLNHHFPTVVCVMTSNSPFTRIPRLRRLMYRDFPRDLRPSRWAVWSAHAGTALELGVPLVIASAQSREWLIVGLAMMVFLHVFITSNVPMGVPIEWNVMVVYGAFALFWRHPEVHFTDLGVTPLAALLAVALVGLPLVGNLAPQRLSFLVSMRYYAGNWPYSVWLFRGQSYDKLARLTKASAFIYEQAERFYDHATSVGLVGKAMAFRLMHLQGRVLSEALPRAVPVLADYEYLEGEVVAGLALGWNFGDGHLHQEQLLAGVQAECGFLPGELRCVFVEGQALGSDRIAYRICDAASGEVARGEASVRELRERQPWETPGGGARFDDATQS